MTVLQRRRQCPERIPHKGRPGDVAMLLREEEGYDVRDGEHLSEMIKNAAVSDMSVSMERAQRDQDADQERQHRDRIRAQARNTASK